MGRLVSRGCAVDPERARQLAADRCRGEPGGHEAQGRLAGLVRSDETDDLAVPNHEIDLLENGPCVSRVAITDAAELEHQGRPTSTPEKRSTRSATSPSWRRAWIANWAAESVILHNKLRRPGRPNALTSSARLRSSTSVRDERMTGPTRGRTPRSRARTLPSVSRPRA